jgi:hypothetical protein
MAVARTAGGIVVTASLALSDLYLVICFMRKAMPGLCTQAPREARDGPLAWGLLCGVRQGAKRAPAGPLGGDWRGGPHGRGHPRAIGYAAPRAGQPVG